MCSVTEELSGLVIWTQTVCTTKPDSYWSLSKQVSIFAEFIWIILSFASQIGLHRFSRSCTGTDILATIHQIKNIEILQTGHVTDAWCNGNKNSVHTIIV